MQLIGRTCNGKFEQGMCFDLIIITAQMTAEAASDRMGADGYR